MTNLWKRSLSLVLAVVMIIGMAPLNVFAEEDNGNIVTINDETTPPETQEPTNEVLPEGVTVDDFGEYTVTDGNGNYYATLQAAVQAIADAKTAGASLYCKPDADVGSLQHAPVISTLTIYGNGAAVTGGSERDFDIGNTDPSGGKDIAADMTLTVKNLDGCGAWGAKATEHTVNLVFENCQNMGKVFITGTTGVLNITMTDCTFEGVIKEAVYSNADGKIELTNVDFANLTKAINLNHKAAGTQEVILTDCDFKNCGNDVSSDQIPVRVLSSVEGGESTLTVSGCTFTGTPAGGADILLPASIGTTVATVSGTAANVSNEGTRVAVKADETYTNVAPKQVEVDTQDELLAALTNGGTVKLIGDIYTTANEEGDVFLYILTGADAVLDLNGHKITPADEDYCILICGDLTITDTSEAGNGSIVAKEQYLSAEYTYVDGHWTDAPVVTINGGIIKNLSVGDETTVVVNGGDVTLYLYQPDYFYEQEEYDDYLKSLTLIGEFEINLPDGYKLDANGTVVADKVYVAEVNSTKYESLQAAIDAAQNGDVIVLQADVSLEDCLTVTKSITIDGNGHKITPADASKTVNSVFMVGDSGWGDDHGETITLKNIKFEGWKTNYGAVRAQGVTLNMTGCEFKGCSVSNAAYAVLSLNYTDATVSNTKFVDNGSRAVDVNYNADGSQAVVTLDGCTFTGNTTDGAGIVYRNAGKLVVKNSVFKNNTVRTNGNAATLYAGWGTSDEISGCTFEGNTVITSHATTKRFASAIFCDGCAVSGNVFGEGNTATRNGESISTIVAVGAYYGDADLSGNYWGGNAPELGVDYTVEFTRKEVELNNYYTDAALTNMVKPPVSVPSTVVDTIVSSNENVSKETVKEIVKDIQSNAALSEPPKNIPADTTMSIVLVDATITAGETSAVTTKLVFDVEPQDANGNEVEPVQAITFRLPVPAGVTATYAKVYHEGTLMGLYEIKTESGAKYVEISSADFSEYAVEFTEETPVAVIGEVGYATLQAAFNAAKDGDTIKLLKNITFTADTAGYTDGTYTDGVRYTGDQSFTVDFNGFTVTDDGCVNDYVIYVNNKGAKANEITFKNGTIVSKNGCWATVCVNSSAATQETVLNLDGMKITNSNDAAYSGNVVVRAREKATVNVNAGTVVTSDGASYGVAASTTGSVVNINNGATVIQKNSGPTGGNSVFAAVGGKGVVNINDGATITSDKYGVHTMTTGTPVINVLGGTIEAPIALKASTNGGTGELATINVTGGTIIGALEHYTDNGKIVVTGGAFTDTSVYDYLAEGYNAEYDKNVKKLVVKVQPVAIVDGTFYTDLQEAINAAGGTKIVYLLRNVTVNIPEFTNVKLATDVASGVTITNTATGWISMTNVTVGQGVTLKAKQMLFDDAGVNVIQGTVHTTSTFYHAYDSKTTVRDGGKIISDGMIVNRYNYNTDSGIYVYGDGDASTVEIYSADTIGTYSGTFYAENAVVEGNMLWIDYKKDTEEADKYAQSNVVFKNSEVKITKEFRLYKDASLTMTGSTVNAGTVQVREAATPVVNIDSASVIKAANVLNLKGSMLKAVRGADNVITFVPAVATIGDETYASLEEAIQAAKAGDEITLLADVTANNVLLIDKSLTIDGNGHKITSGANRVIRITKGDVEVELSNLNLVSTAFSSYTNDIRGVSIDGNISNVQLTMNNCSVDFDPQSGSDWAYAVNVTGGTGHTVTINGGTYEGANVINIRGDNHTISIDGATLNCLYNAPQNGYYGQCVRFDGTGSNATIKNTTFNGVHAIAVGEATTVSNTVAQENNTDNTKRYIAKIGDTYYYTLAEAVAAANVGDTVTLVASVTVDQLIKIEKAITLDLNGCRVTSTAQKAFEIYANATIKNGTIVAAQRCVDTRKAVELTLTDVTLTADKYSSAYGNPQPLTIGGSEDGTEVNMTNVQINAGTAGYGIITFVKTDLTATDSTIGGYSALYVKPGSEESTFTFVNTDLSGSTVNNDVAGNSMSVVAVRADGVTVNVDADSSITASGEHCVAIDLGSEFAGEQEVSNATVVVTGTITGNVLYVPKLDSNIVTVPVANAATLNSDGYAYIDNGDGTITAAKAVAKVGETNYATLQAAIDGAQAGDMVTLLADVTIDKLIKIEKAITLDLNGCKVTSTAQKAFEIYANATIKNGTIVAVQRCVDTRKAVELTLTDVTLTADKYSSAYGNPQPLTIGGSEDGTKVNMTKVQINAGTAGYGIITFVKTDLTATDSTIGGYSALYVKPGSEESTFTFVNTDLSGSTVNNDVAGNSMSVVAVRADGVAVHVDADSSITASGKHCVAIDLGSEFAGEQEVSNATVVVNGTITGNVLYVPKLDSNIVTVPVANAATLNSDGYAYIDNGNGTITAIEAVAQIGETKYVSLQEAVRYANPGDMIELLCDTDEVVIVNKELIIKTNKHDIFLLAPAKGYLYEDGPNDTIVFLHKSSISIGELGASVAYIDANNDGVRTNEELMPLQVALNAAAPGQIVRLTKNLSIPTAAVMIPVDVTLDIQGYTLEINSMIGFEGSQLTGNTVASDGTGSGKIVINKKNLVMKAKAFVNAKGQDVLPVWIEGTGYIFSLVDPINANAKPKLTITDTTISAVFRHNASGYTNKKLLMNGGGSKYGLSVKITLTWDILNEETGEFIAKASQTFSYTDKLIETVADNQHNYVFKLSNYKNMGVDLESLQITVTMESDSGIVATGYELNSLIP